MTVPATLPVLACQPEILAALASAPAVIVVGDTGSGKSTQLPRMFVEAGYRVLVTEPRRLATSTLAERVAEEMGVEVGGLVGYRTGRDVPHDGPETRLWYMTDALVLMRELSGDGGGYDVLVIDELHEFGLMAEVLLAWARRELDRPTPRFKLVVLSATLDAESLAAYLGTPDAPAPVVRVPGRMHPIEDRPPQRPALDLHDVLDSMAAEIRALVRTGHNVLAFVPGKGEIDQITAALGRIDAEILPLHGQMSREEQARCFLHYPRPRCVISTNVAQTSLTIDGIDVVVDSGFERRVETRGGVEGIYLGYIAEASSTQRRGRAGRTGPGIYISHKPPGQHPLYPVPEIRRVLLDQAVLRLAQAGLDMATVPFFHQPPPDQIEAAKVLLTKLGAMTPSGQVTPMGTNIAQLPVSVRAGRALVEAARRGGRALLEAVATGCALVDTGSIGNDRMSRAWRRFAGPHTDSDVLAQMYALAAVEHLGAEELDQLGFLPLKVAEAREQRVEIARAAGEVLGEGAVPDKPLDLAEVVLCMAAGMVDQLRVRWWNQNGWPAFGADGRRIGRESVVDGGPRRDDWADEFPEDEEVAPELEMWVVGLPFDIGAPRGTVEMLRAVSVVRLKDMVALAPEAVLRIVGTPTYDLSADLTTAPVEVTLFGESLLRSRAPIDAHPETGQRLRAMVARILQGGVMIDPKDRAPHRATLRKLAMDRARAIGENARLKRERWPQPSVEALVARIPADATRLAPHLHLLAVPAPPLPQKKASRKRPATASQPPRSS